MLVILCLHTTSLALLGRHQLILFLIKATVHLHLVLYYTSIPVVLFPCYLLKRMVIFCQYTSNFSFVGPLQQKSDAYNFYHHTEASVECTMQSHIATVHVDGAPKLCEGHMGTYIFVTMASLFKSLLPMLTNRMVKQNIIFRP